MTKNQTFLLSMLIVSITLWFPKMTGLMGHISISVSGLFVMIYLTLCTRKEWKKPALEIILRAMYLIALITGGVMAAVQNVPALNIIHAICAAAFAILLLVLYLPKLKK